VAFISQAKYAERATAVAGIDADFCCFRVLRVQRNGSQRLLISVFKTGSVDFSLK
jgi:hypothetical protein